MVSANSVVFGLVQLYGLKVTFELLGWKLTNSETAMIGGVAAAAWWDYNAYRMSDETLTLLENGLMVAGMWGLAERAMRTGRLYGALTHDPHNTEIP